MSPRFSVVIPVYNRARSVLPTLESVRNQTFEDFECIVVDDGSADGEELRVVVEGLGDARFRYIRRINGGEGAARNTGIDAAAGQLVAFLDSDDEWLPGKLAWDSDASRTNRVTFSQVIIARKGEWTGRRPTRGPESGEDIPEYLFRHQGFTAPSSIGMPLDLARKVRWDERVKFGADADFAVRVALAGAEFRMSETPLVVMHDDETEDRQSRLTDWRATKEWLDRIRPFISDRAYCSCLGWHVGRQAAEAGDYSTALRFYFDALFHGAFPIPLAVKALIQILIRRPTLRRIRNLAANA
jgi:glycosyltransferase involved in cell wall biosynthesis